MDLRAVDESLADAAVKLCIDAYNILPKNGKPTSQEWTVIAGFIEEVGSDLRIVSLGTGTKCLGRNLLSPQGNLLHDSHAEVIARRNLLLYLYDEITALRKNGLSKILEDSVPGKIRVKANVRFGFVSSTVPCGDSAIIPVEETSQTLNDGLETEPSPKRRRLAGDIHRTGAKCLPEEDKQDLKLPGTNYHTVGAVRTKPGRGDPTASVSCTDKIARWNAVGVQGALLSLFLEEPVYLEYIVIGGGGPFSQNSLERGINERVGTPKKTSILQSSIPFPTDRNNERQRPAPVSISWCISSKHGQVCVEGRRLGATKKNPLKAALDIAKMKILERFVTTAELCSESLKLQIDENLRTLSYRHLKDRAASYQRHWKVVREKYFKVWTQKPSGLENFSLGDCE